jgi:hypothetical protein
MILLVVMIQEANAQSARQILLPTPYSVRIGEDSAFVIDDDCPLQPSLVQLERH